MNNNIRVGNLFGIPIYLNPSWFLVLGLVTLTYGQELTIFFTPGSILPWFLGFITAILLFSSVVAHELGHSLVAISQGIEVKSITLFLFGGVASLEKESEKPWQSLLIALAGPGVSLLLSGLFTLIIWNLTLSPPLQAIVLLLGTINLFLALFNLIPGLPLDGGNVLKAIIWQITGDPNRGILIASRFGQFFGWLGIAIGIFASFGLIPFGSFWTALIGWFILTNASNYVILAKIQAKLSHLTAADAVLPNSPIISEELNLRQFANDYVIGKQSWRRFLVTNSEGKLVGVIAIDDLKKVPTSDWNNVLVREILAPVENMTIVESDRNLLDVVQLIEQKQIKEIIVLDKEQKLLGLIEKIGIISLLQEAKT